MTTWNAAGVSKITTASLSLQACSCQGQESLGCFSMKERKAARHSESVSSARRACSQELQEAVTTYSLGLEFV